MGVAKLFLQEVKRLCIRGLLWKGKKVENRRNVGVFFEVKLRGLAEGLNLGVKGGQEPKMVLWFLASATG